MGKDGRKNEQLESYEVPQLNEALGQFFAELRKGSGKEYEPDSLKVMHAALDRHIRSKDYRERYRVLVVKKSLDEERQGSYASLG